MFQFLVNAEGGLTTAGYVLCIAAGILLFVAALVFAGRISEKKKMGTRQLVFCAMAMALAFITSYLKLFNMPWGGSVTLCSMLFIVLIANWYGPKTGILVGLAYGILQFIQEPYVLSLFQVCCDYILAFAALGVAGFFAKNKHGLLRRFPRPGRLSLLDGLHARQFSKGAYQCISYCLQLQLFSCRRNYNCDHHFHPCSI